MLSALFLGAAAAATGISGVKSAVNAGKSTVQAKHINEEATAVVEAAGDRLDVQRTACGKTLDNLGEEKLSKTENDSSGKTINEMIDVPREETDPEGKTENWY